MFAVFFFAALLLLLVYLYIMVVHIFTATSYYSNHTSFYWNTSYYLSTSITNRVCKDFGAPPIKKIPFQPFIFSLKNDKEWCVWGLERTTSLDFLTILTDCTNRHYVIFSGNFPYSYSKSYALDAVKWKRSAFLLKNGHLKNKVIRWTLCLRTLLFLNLLVAQLLLRTDAILPYRPYL